MKFRWNRLLFSGGVAGIAGLYASSSNEYVPYVLIGGGTASYFAALTIRGRQADAKVLIIGDESNELWLTNADPTDSNSLEYIGFKGRRKHISYEADGFYIHPRDLDQFPHGCISLLRNTKAVKIDAEKGKVYLADGREIRFDKCLIATGSRPVLLPVFDHPDMIDKIEDYIALRKVAEPGTKIVVVDEGFLGSELSFSLRQFAGDVEVVQLVPGKECLSQVLAPELARQCGESIEASGVRVIRNCKVESAKKLPNGKVYLRLATDRGVITVMADYIVDGLQWKPNVEVAENSGLELDPQRQGILVNAEMQARHNIFAAGDVASFYDTQLGRLRVQHLEHAEISGRCAGENMTGGAKVLPRKASFRSRIGEAMFLEGVGRTEASLKTTENGLHRWISFYLERGRVVGVLTCNLSFSLEFARKLIEDGEKDLDLKEVAKLFSLYRIEKEPESSSISAE